MDLALAYPDTLLAVTSCVSVTIPLKHFSSPPSLSCTARFRVLESYFHRKSATKSSLRRVPARFCRCNHSSHPVFSRRSGLVNLREIRDHQQPFPPARHRPPSPRLSVFESPREKVQALAWLTSAWQGPETAELYSATSVRVLEEALCFRVLLLVGRGARWPNRQTTAASLRGRGRRLIRFPTWCLR